MRKYLLLSCTTVLVAVLLFGVGLAVAATDVPRMSTDELKSRLGEADLVVLDVRSNWDWGQSDKKIVDSERVKPAEVSQWASLYAKDKVIVLYCA